MSRKAKVKVSMEASGQLVRISSDFPGQNYHSTSMLFVDRHEIGTIVGVDRDMSPIVLWSGTKILHMSLAHLEFV